MSDPVKPRMAGREWGMGNGEWGMYMYLAMGCILVHSNTNVKEKVYNYSAYTVRRMVRLYYCQTRIPMQGKRVYGDVR